MWRKSKTAENRTKYVNQRNLCAELSITKQESYYSKLVEASSNNQKSLFKVVDELLNKKNEKILPAHTDPLKLANEFNDYYIEKIDKLRETIPLITANTFETENFDGEKMDSFALTTQEELKQIIKEFGVKISSEDPLPIQILKSVIDVSFPCLTELVNKSLAELSERSKSL